MGRVVLHIGAMKTGTSFVQSILLSQRDVLGEQGFALLGERVPVIRAVQGVVNPARWPESPDVPWSDFAAQARESSQTLVASMEFLSFADDKQVATLVEPFAGVQLDVVATVRDEFRAIPAQWQSYCRSLGTSSWAKYLREISRTRRTARRSGANRSFRRARSLPTILERWRAQPGVSAVHAVVVPGADAPRDELWTRFCAAAGIDPAPFEIHVAKSNASIGYGSCDFLRKLNVHLTDVDRKAHRRVMRRLVPDVLGPLRDGESRPGFDARGAEFARSMNRQLVDTLSSGRFEVHGDLGEVPVPDRLDGYPDKPAMPPTSETQAAADAMWAYLAKESGEDGRAPRPLDATIEETARLLRRANDW
jgi:hypothetical protein